jgi:predicted MFS family arabinose efflux permease
MAVPLFPLHWVRTLNADDNAIGTVSMVQSVTLLIGYTLGTYFATKFNARVAILRICAIALGIYPLITAPQPASNSSSLTFCSIVAHPDKSPPSCPPTSS